MKMTREIRLLIVLFFAIALIIFTELVLRIQSPRKDAAEMREARELAGKWMGIVDSEKQHRGIAAEVKSGIKHSNFLGAEFTPVTTTLGSLEAKEFSTNPEFAALVMRLLHEAGITSDSRVGITLSGSFPALGIAALAALQILSVEVTMFSSLGASSYGANQVGALWIDYERWLIESGELRYKSELVTYGGENDNGTAIYPEGIQAIDSTLAEYGIEPYRPGNLHEAVAHKTMLLLENDINLLINIGGNQASLGACQHALEIPPGLIQSLLVCDHPNRGLIHRFSRAGIPVIQLLNIRELAIKYGIKHPANGTNHEPDLLYNDQFVNRVYLVILFVVLLIAVWWIKNPSY